jgi:hypothetical protein
MLLFNRYLIPQTVRCCGEDKVGFFLIYVFSRRYDGTTAQLWEEGGLQSSSRQILLQNIS